MLKSSADKVQGRTRLLTSFFIAAAIVVSGQHLPASNQTRLSSPAVAIRPGTASGLFDPASGIGDVDRDGAPDIMRADRVSTRNGRTRYRFDVDLSHGAKQRIDFSSAQPALRLVIVDIDGDGDQDVVFTKPLSRHVAAVLSNDGTGRFHHLAVVPRSMKRLPAAPTTWSARPLGDSDTALEGGVQYLSGAGATRLPAPMPSSEARTRVVDRSPCRPQLDFRLFTRPPPPSDL